MTTLLVILVIILITICLTPLALILAGLYLILKFCKFLADEDKEASDRK